MKIIGLTRIVRAINDQGARTTYAELHRATVNGRMPAIEQDVNGRYSTTNDRVPEIVQAITSHRSAA